MAERLRVLVLSLIIALYSILFAEGVSNSSDCRLELKPIDFYIQVGTSGTLQLRTTCAYADNVTVWLPAKSNEFPLSLAENPIILPENSTKWTNVKCKATFVTKYVLKVVNCSLGDSGDCPMNMSEAYSRVNVVHSSSLQIVIDVVGWMYFIAWSVSFYPQIILNCQRKSVMGLSFDFLSLNFLGFVCYSIYNCVLYFSSAVQAEYFVAHPHSVIPVQPNDVGFALHAVFATSVTILQCIVFERANQRVSRLCMLLLCVLMLFLVICFVLQASSVINWLLLIQLISYVKLVITLVKYVPQAVMNLRRKSTQGWSIGNVLLDFTGGLLSLVQMFMIAYNNDDWSSLFGDFTKFGLGFFSLLFDVLFMVQHYILYGPNALNHQRKFSGDDSVEPETPNYEGRNSHSPSDSYHEDMEPIIDQDSLDIEHRNQQTHEQSGYGAVR